MHIHILGICGTFMGGIAGLAAANGHTVTGSDENVYPPMSTQLEKLGITLKQGYLPEHLEPQPDVVIIGNALSRGNPAVEHVLNVGIPYQSGPQWLAENLLKDRWVIALAGTHGKTTTSSMVAWILEHAGLNPGFLIGGVPGNFGVSARWGDAPFFVVEADEYDSAFFDKRSKFVHYHPRTCVLNNLEFDHADIFDNLNDIKKQFHHLVRTVPGNGAIIVPEFDAHLEAVLKMGVWSEVQHVGSDKALWQAKLLQADGSRFEVVYRGKSHGTVIWDLIGMHNVNNALAAIAASVHAGVKPDVAIEALAHFKSVKRRMEVLGVKEGVTVYDDFAHHPTAMKTTVSGLRAKIGKTPLIAVVDLRSNTLCLGTHREELPEALIDADHVFVYQSPKVTWDVKRDLKGLGDKLHVYQGTQPLLEALVDKATSGDHVLVMSNGGFDDLHQRLLEGLDRSRVHAE